MEPGFSSDDFTGRIRIPAGVGGGPDLFEEEYGQADVETAIAAVAIAGWLGTAAAPGEMFFQKNLDHSTPGWVPRASITHKERMAMIDISRPSPRGPSRSASGSPLPSSVTDALITPSRSSRKS